MEARKTEFWWASIAGADPEPVEKTEHEGRPCVYTLGCADPFFLDEPGVLFVAEGGGAYYGDDKIYESGTPEPMKRPLHPDKDKAAQASEYRRRKRQAHHGWRGPR